MNKRVNNIEFLWSEHNNRYEIIVWVQRTVDIEYNYVAASFAKTGDGYHMVTIGKRYHDALKSNPTLVIAITEYAFAFLGAEFDLEYQVKELS